MATIYKVHPAVGIARVGDSTTDFFVGPEVPGVDPIELAVGGEVPLRAYKDQAGRIKRQGARFRVFGYDQAADGTLSNPVEVPGGSIEWTVHLVNRKAAWEQTISMPAPRNPSVTGAARASLVIDPGPKTITGKNAAPVELTGGSFKGQAVSLGTLRTDADGRLVVLGGYGKSDSVPANRPVGGVNFADNPDWYDDVGDGPVTAKLSLPGQAPFVVQFPGWIVVAPPDFAPGVGGVVTLWDIATEVAVTSFGVSQSARPSFTRDVFPILSRSASLRWTHDADEWLAIPEDWKRLSSATDVQTRELRAELAEVLGSDLPPLPLRDRSGMLKATGIQRRALSAWAAGNFDDDWNGLPGPQPMTPDNLDRAPLEATVGGGFFPGIEAGRRLKDKTFYDGAYRIKKDLKPGTLTEEMALPWQSDFMQCKKNWWPAQRPDFAPQQGNPDGDPPPWIAGIITKPEGSGAERQMVDNFGRLGFIVPVVLPGGRVVHIERERDPAFPR